MNTIMLPDYEQLARALRQWTEEPGPSALQALAGALQQPSSRNVEEMLGFPSRRLAVYGTLAPGRSNHGQLAGLSGRWTAGFVRGTLRPAGWGLSHGYPGLIWNPSGERVAVQLFASPDLERHWDRLDAFEGEDYPRVLIPVEREGELLVANIYALSDALSFEFGAREIHLWRASLDLPSESLTPLAATLCAEERARAGRFHFEHDRRRFVACRGWLRILLGRYRRSAPEQIHLAYSPNGKPYVDGGPHFNVSHSNDLGLFAFCAEEEVGVDLEAVREMPDAEEIARRYFSPPGIERWIAVPPPIRTQAFFDSWTRHESVTKAVGETLSRLPDPGEAWSVFDLKPPNGYAAALAIRGEGWNVCDMGQCSRGRPVSPNRIG